MIYLVFSRGTHKIQENTTEGGNHSKETLWKAFQRGHLVWFLKDEEEFTKELVSDLCVPRPPGRAVVQVDRRLG